MHGYWLPAGQELTEEQIKTFRGYRTFVVKKRWIVECGIAWMTFQHRLNRECDLLPNTTEAWVMLTFIRLMIRRLSAAWPNRLTSLYPARQPHDPFQTASKEEGYPNLSG